MNHGKSIQLPEKLVQELNSLLKQSSFKSIDDFIIYIIQNYLDQLTPKENQAKSSGDDEAIMKRLQDLGYM
ncbi:MAG: ribbon-helix-helix domain-containing protein [Calditrichaceae bacterium]